MTISRKVRGVHKNLNARTVKTLFRQSIAVLNNLLGLELDQKQFFGHEKDSVTTNTSTHKHINAQGVQHDTLWEQTTEWSKMFNKLFSLIHQSNSCSTPRCFSYKYTTPQRHCLYSSASRGLWWCHVISRDVKCCDLLWCEAVMRWYDVMVCDVKRVATWSDVLWCDLMWSDVIW